jgi:hypothetical protein
MAILNNEIHSIIINWLFLAIKMGCCELDFLYIGNKEGFVTFDNWSWLFYVEMELDKCKCVTSMKKGNENCNYSLLSSKVFHARCGKRNQ